MKARSLFAWAMNMQARSVSKRQRIRSKASLNLRLGEPGGDDFCSLRGVRMTCLGKGWGLSWEPSK